MASSLFHRTNILFLLLFIAVWPTSLCISNDHRTQVETEYTNGILIANSSPTPVFYETYISVIIQYQLPYFTYTSLQLQDAIKSHTMCQFTQFNKTCIPNFYMEEMLKEQFVPNFLWNDFISDNHGGTTPISGEMDSYEFCTLIKKHFHRPETHYNNINSYTQKLKNCPLTGDFIVNRTTYPTTTSTRHSHYQTMHSQMSLTFYNHLNNYANGIAYLTNELAIYGIFLLNEYIESQRWAKLISACQSGNLGSSHTPSLPYNELKTMLQDIDGKLLKKNYKLAIDTQDLGLYYQLPLTDCIFSTTQSYGYAKQLVVRFLIPILAKQSNYQFISVRSIPFIKGNSSSDRQVCFVKDVDNKSYIQNENTNYIHESLCASSELCNVRKIQDENFMSTLIDSCIATVRFNQSQDIIEKSCSLECYPSDPIKNSEPYFRIAGTGSVIVSGGNVNTTVFVMCHGVPIEVIKPFYHGEGALKIGVPCDCQVIYNSAVIFVSHKPCPDSFTIKRLLPLAWMAQEKVNQSNQVALVKNVTSQKEFKPQNETKNTVSSFIKDQDDPLPQKIDVSSFAIEQIITFANSALIFVLIVAIACILHNLYLLNSFYRRYKSDVDRLVTLNGYDGSLTYSH